MNGHPQLGGLSNSLNQEFSGSSSTSSNIHPKPNELSQGGSSNGDSTGQWQSPSWSPSNGRPGSVQNPSKNPTNSIAKPGSRPSGGRPSQRPEYPSYPEEQYPEDQYSDYPEQQYPDDYHHHDDYPEQQYPEEYPEQQYPDDYQEEQQYTSRPIIQPQRPTKSSGGGLLSALVDLVAKLI